MRLSVSKSDRRPAEQKNWLQIGSTTWKTAKQRQVDILLVFMVNKDNISLLFLCLNPALLRLCHVHFFWLQERFTIFLFILQNTRFCTLLPIVFFRLLFGFIVVKTIQINCSTLNENHIKIHTDTHLFGLSTLSSLSWQFHIKLWSSLCKVLKLCYDFCSCRAMEVPSKAEFTN